MTTDHDEFPGRDSAGGADDFWGAQAQWPEVPEADRRPPRASAATTVSHWWNAIVGGSSTAHRTHGTPSVTSRSDRPDANASHLAELRRPQPASEQRGRAHRESPVEALTSQHTDGNVEIWDGDWELDAPRAPRGGVDPLLARAGGAAIVLTLLVPLFLGFGGGDDSNSETVATLEPPSTIAVPTTVATPVAPIVDGAGSVASAPPSNAGPTTAEPSAATAAPTTSAAPEVDSAQAALADGGSSDGLVDGAVASDPAERIDPPCAIEYTIVAGDFWIRIADGSGASLADLLEVNDATTSTPIYPGSTICLPAGSTLPSAPPVATTPSTPPASAAPVTTAPAPAPTSPPVATAPPAGATPTAAQVQQIIRDVWPDDLEARAIEIADRESNFVPTAKNYCCYGVFQIYWSVHQSWLAGLGITSAEQLYDPTTNARAAYALYQRAGGWGPWT